MAAVPRHYLKIIDLNWTPAMLVYSIQCTCDTIFPYPAKTEPKNHKVKCPTCGFTASLDSLRRDWEEKAPHPDVKKGEAS